MEKDIITERQSCQGSDLLILIISITSENVNSFFMEDMLTTKAAREVYKHSVDSIEDINI